MIFAAPLALLGLLALPAILLLLRFTPPAARRVRFPPLALLRDLTSTDQNRRHIPLWLLILRTAAAALIILGLADPILHPPASLPGTGPILLVIDNGWSTAADWPARRDAADHVLTAAALAGRGVAILPTAPPAGGAAPMPGLMPASQARQIVDALQPVAWPADRRAATIALRGAAEDTRIYIADGITDGPGFAAFMQAVAPTRIIAAPGLPPLLLDAQLTATDNLAVHAINIPPGGTVSARASNDAVLANATFIGGEALLATPAALIGQLSRLTLDGPAGAAPASAASVLLLDASAHGALVGLAAGAGAGDAPYVGPLYFLRRALPAGTRTVTGAFAALLAAKPGLIILADLPLDAGQRAAARRYIAAGGILLRFAGPLTATPDDLSPDLLLAGDRHLGGALTWSAPQSLAAFPAASPFAGLATDARATVTRQLLADPTRLNPATVWASLADGTPLIIAAKSGRGTLVSVLTSANADWANLALSGLYPALLGRLAQIASGTPPQPTKPQPLQAELTAYGALAPASTTANLAAADRASTAVSLQHPPGLYGAGAGALALNLGGHIPPPIAAALPGAVPLAGSPPATEFGTDLIVAALLILATDLLISLHRRGLLALRRPALLALLLLPAFSPAQAGPPTRLGYLQTNDAATDQLSAAGLAYLSADISMHTSISLGDPVPLDPARSDLDLYPVIYWPLTAGAPPLAAAACVALNGYMTHGGLLVIDTAGGAADAPGSGAGFAPGAAAALDRATACLALPPLQALAATDVLARCFFILHEFSGRFTGAPVLIAAPAARDADGVSPVIIGQNGWAGAWARDPNGVAAQLPIPGGEDQRVIADRFGTNIVVYALTGSYKADQAALPTSLDKLGP